MSKGKVGREMPNVLLITIDSLRFDHLGCYGYHKNTSPNIDRLASKGTLFLEAVSNGGCTTHAFPSLLASALPPLDENEWRTIMQQHTTLAELLHQAGYCTAAFHSNPYLSRFYNYGKGFDTFEDNLRRTSPRNLRRLMGQILAMGHRLPKPLIEPFLRPLANLEMLPEVLSLLIRGRPIITAQQISQQAISWLKSPNGNFFLWLHYMDVHIPYMPPQKYVEQFHGHWGNRYEMTRLYRKMIIKPAQVSISELERLNNLYDADIKYVDDAIGWLLDKAGSQLENTIIIVTADHGDEFGEHGKFSHRTVYDGLLRIPLILTGPGIKTGSTVREQVSLLDLAPTVVDLVGLGKVNTFHGESLVPLMKGEAMVTKGVISTTVSLIRPKPTIVAYRTPRWKYIRTESLNREESALREELYDLRNDQGETKNLHGAGIEAARKFELEAKNKVSQFKQLKIEERTLYEKERVKVSLKKLGKL